MVQPLHVGTHWFALTSQISLAPQVLVPATQVSDSSSQLSSPLQALPSSQVQADPEQEPPEQLSSIVQNRPSSQRAPSLSDQEVVDVATEQI